MSDETDFDSWDEAWKSWESSRPAKLKAAEDDMKRFGRGFIKVTSRGIEFEHVPAPDVIIDP
jgi:hypothetical protein